MLLSQDNQITAQALLLESGQKVDSSIVLQPLEEAEKQLITKAMDVANGQVIEAAKLLGISRNALYRRLEKFNFNYEP